MLKLVALILAALAFWFAMFFPWVEMGVNFWLLMFAATGFLSAFAIHHWVKHPPRPADKFKPAHFIIGVVSAAVLYFIFWAGEQLAPLVLGAAREQIDGIYSTKAQGSSLAIGLLLFFWIGPAEELFWRGYVQRVLAGKYGAWAACVATALVYTLVHIWGFNLMLLLASLICGVFWGFMYNHYKSVWPGLISHALWDVAVFVLWPL